MMFKRVCFIFMAVILAMNIYGQRESDSIFFYRYSNPQLHDADYFVLKVSANTPRQFLNNLILKSERRLSDDVFIITKEDRQQLNLPATFVLKSQAANNNWKLSATVEKEMGVKNDKMNFRFIVQFKNKEWL